MITVIIFQSYLFNKSNNKKWWFPLIVSQCLVNYYVYLTAHSKTNCSTNNENYTCHNVCIKFKISHILHKWTKSCWKWILKFWKMWQCTKFHSWFSKEENNNKLHNAHTLSLQSTWTFPPSRTFRICSTLPCNAARWSCWSDGVSFWNTKNTNCKEFNLVTDSDMTWLDVYSRYNSNPIFSLPSILWLCKLCEWEFIHFLPWILYWQYTHGQQAGKYVISCARLSRQELTICACVHDIQNSFLVLWFGTLTTAI